MVAPSGKSLDGLGPYGKLSDYLHGPKVVHRLDPWHLNRKIGRAFPDPQDSSLLFDLLHEGNIDELLDVPRLRLETDYGDEGKTRELLGYIENNRIAIKVAAPSMETMEGTNAHLYAEKMMVWGGAWSRKRAGDTDRIRAVLFSGERLSMPQREPTFSGKDRKRREHVLEKMRYEFGYEGVRFPTGQVFRAIFNPLN
ncbi:MAG: hypothetical protein HGA39_06390 [Coriobacteriia bacterium]|nr:hypothetical protein [Coriobacteriia bacterium]